MVNIDINVVKEYIQLLKENKLSELTINDGNKFVTIKDENAKQAVVPSISAPVIVQETISAVTEEQDTKSASPQSKGTPILSPMAGTFYSSSAPDAPPYVQIGSKIQQGQVVCIIEAMKLMNELESEIGGTIIEICVKNGDTVDADQILMVVE